MKINQNQPTSPKINQNQPKIIKNQAKSIKSIKIYQNEPQNAPRASNFPPEPSKIMHFLLHSKGVAGVAAGVVNKSNSELSSESISDSSELS